MSYVNAIETSPRLSSRPVPRPAGDLAQTIAGAHAELVSIAGLIRLLVPETDHRSVDQRRRLLRQLRIRTMAHARGLQCLFPAARRLAREHDDIAARLDQMQVIPLDHPLWISHFDELEQRLVASAATAERELLFRLRQLADEDQLMSCYLVRRQETLAALERPIPGRRAVRRQSGQQRVAS
jgi:hypothetical protein